MTDVMLFLKQKINEVIDIYFQKIMLNSDVKPMKNDEFPFFNIP